MSDLDDPGLLQLDTSGMFKSIAELGTEMIRAWDAAAELELPPGAAEATSVVIAGMGGSATAGDYFATLCWPASEVPVSVVRGYSLPNYVSDRTFVIVSSYSGNTEEALSAYDDAWKRGAPLLALTTGGKLAERALSDSVAVHHITYESQPRAAIAHSLAPLLRLGAERGLCFVTDPDVREAGESHRAFVESQLQPRHPASRNGAKQLAAALHRRTALIVGAEHLAPVASRFKNQLAENGKALAAADSLPEANHNLVVGLETGSVAGQSLSLVLLESQLYAPRIRRRFEVTADQFERAGVPVHRVEVAGTTVLEQLLIGTAWGDYVSCYLALLNGVDPTPVRQIDQAKAALA
jgi:glucose/mannose-6-phosphate isomerase